ncbi:MAG: hypothetical protein NZV14_10955 [Bryobacteraceae bacterium]|nr:hypothetical protein [Bryobacteraceae bacterium]MDW8378672.1 hypothetical protein [Bryobacterales bacterium]
MLENFQGMIPHLVALSVLVLITVALAVYRAAIAQKQDFHLHYEPAESVTLSKQIEIDRRMHLVDNLGKAFTVLTVLYFLFVAGLVVYEQWQNTYKITMSN